MNPKSNRNLFAHELEDAAFTPAKFDELASDVLENTLTAVRTRASKKRRMGNVAGGMAVLAMIAGVVAVVSNRQSRSDLSKQQIPTVEEPIVPRVTPHHVERLQTTDSFTLPATVKTEEGIASAMVEHIDTNELMALLAKQGGGIIQLSSGEKIAKVVD